MCLIVLTWAEVLMAQLLRMPSYEELPDGARRRFTQELHEHYRAARRPQLQAIADYLAEHDELAGTASRETIRRMLRGTTVPPRWHTADAVFRALCALAGRDPDGYKHDSYWGNVEPPTWAEDYERAWNAALDDTDES